MAKYAYVVEGLARGNAPWRTEGQVSMEVGNFQAATQLALANSYEQLTDGRATYGDLNTCQGPYQITKLILERMAT